MKHIEATWYAKGYLSPFKNVLTVDDMFKYENLKKKMEEEYMIQVREIVLTRELGPAKIVSEAEQVELFELAEQVGWIPRLDSAANKWYAYNIDSDEVGDGLFFSAYEAIRSVYRG